MKLRDISPYVHSAPLILVIGLLLLMLIPTSIAQPIYPTVTVTIHRIQRVDAIEGILEGQADWYFHLGYRPYGEPTYSWIGPIYAPGEQDDATIDEVITFQVQTDLVWIVIEVCEDDAATPDDYADVSSDIAEGVDNVDCFTRPSTWYAGSFRTRYSLDSNSMTGDDVTQELGWFKTSGEFDGSTGGDTNDANVFFDIEDNYESPTANAGSDRTGYTGDTFSFDGTPSTGSAGSSIEQYGWDFTGDSVTDVTGSIVSWTFNTKGVHTIWLTVTDSLGIIDIDLAQVEILNRAPIAAFGYGPTDPTVQDEISFADTSSDQDGTIESWYWQLGDGTTSTLPNPTHKYSTNGAKTVTLTVTDNDGTTASVSEVITISNLAPVANFTYSPGIVTTGDIVEFTDGSTDPDGIVVSWSWDFGDGSTSGTQDPTHNFGAPGAYTVTLTVVDDDGGTHSVTKTTTVIQGIPGGTIGGVPILVIGAIAIAGGAAAAGLHLKRRGGQKSEAKPDESSGTDEAAGDDENLGSDDVLSFDWD